MLSELAQMNKIPITVYQESLAGENVGKFTLFQHLAKAKRLLIVSTNLLVWRITDDSANFPLPKFPDTRYRITNSTIKTFTNTICNTQVCMCACTVYHMHVFMLL